MATLFKRNLLQLDGTLQTVYTVPTGTTTVVIGLRVANKSASDGNVSILVNDGVTSYYFGPKDVLIPTGSSLEFIDGKLVLQAGDSIQAQASAPGLFDLTLSIMERN